MNVLRGSVLSVLVALPMLCSAKQSDTATSGSATSKFPLTTCIVSNEKLGEHGKPVAATVDGRTVMLCCKSCEDELKENPKKILARLDEAIIKAEKRTYPLSTCAVSGKALPSSGAKDVVLDNHLVRLCCSDCEASARKNPAATLGKVEAARTK